MTLEDLREHDVLLPEEEWGSHELKSTTRQPALLVLLVTATAALVLAYLGDGGVGTWIGTAAFLLCLGAITWLCDRAVSRQRRRSRRERTQGGPGQASEAATPTAGTTRR